MLIIDSVYIFQFNQGVNLQKRKYKKMLNTCELYIYCMKKDIFWANKNKNKKRVVPETPVRPKNRGNFLDYFSHLILGRADFVAQLLSNIQCTMYPSDDIRPFYLQYYIYSLLKSHHGYNINIHF